jgi:hypothetical protein
MDTDMNADTDKDTEPDTDMTLFAGLPSAV